MARDLTSFHEPMLRPLLAPEEKLLLSAPLIQDPGTVEDVSVRDELLNLLDPTVLIGLGSHPGELGQRLFFGRAARGVPGSLGRRVHEAAGALGPLLVLTDARLLIASRRDVPRKSGWFNRIFGPSDQVAEIVLAVPRGEVLGAAAAPAGVFRRGRFIVGFRDDSLCALVSGLPSQGRRAVEIMGAEA
ncbi:hypothetical protein ACNTMW_17085 [Planosporangium sp. 12N6]|uniref:hypothetical protein n=1 Tax=Planosporangium spinosum TaxID=3402278 RepID=UPI003CE98FF4